MDVQRKEMYHDLASRQKINRALFDQKSTIEENFVNGATVRLVDMQLTS